MAKNNIKALEADKALGLTDESVTQREVQETSTTTDADSDSEVQLDVHEAIIQRLNATLKRLTTENETKDRIINLQNDKILQLEKLSGLVSKDGLTVSRDGETYRVVDGITKSIHHNHVAVKVVDFTDDMIKEYVEKGFLERV